MPETKRRGIDVSSYQNPQSIDWHRLRELGYDFVWVRAVRMGREIDSRAAAHVRVARAAKVSVGLYAFFSPSEPVIKQARLMREAMKLCDMLPGDLAPALDIESTNSFRASPGWVTPCAQLLSTYRYHWGAAARYHNIADWVAMGRPSELEEYPLWLAAYRDTPGMDCAVWQCASAPIDGYGKLPLDQNVVLTELPRIGHPTT
jgi:lysozyme